MHLGAHRYLQSEPRNTSFRQSNGFSRVHWRVHSNKFETVSLRILFSKFSVTTRLTLSVPQAEGHFIVVTEERKLEVPPRERLRMSYTFRYIYMYDIASVYIANRRRARVWSGIWRILRFRSLPPEIDLKALLCGNL